MSPEARSSPRRLSLALRIYLAALLPLVMVSLILGVLDLFSLGPPLEEGATRPDAGHLLMPLGLVLVLISIVSVLVARSLARPISHLTRSAASFGAGDLSARARLQRTDELGDLARTFDEMADRITSLVGLQKELLANVSHELRTPLSRIRVALDVIDPESLGNQAPELAGIQEDLKELEQLVGNIMMTARLDLEAGRAGQASLPLNLEQTDSREVLDGAIARFRQRSPSRALELAVDPELPQIVADPIMLRRVLDNLLDNSHKYSDPDQSITLRARGGDDELVVEVVDQGIGISPEHLEKVFQPFFRVDHSRTRSTGGVGLGLALCHHIMEAHEGTIALESEPEQGTTARLTVPAL